MPAATKRLALRAGEASAIASSTATAIETKTPWLRQSAETPARTAATSQRRRRTCKNARNDSRRNSDSV
jgi:hypothetical protein